MGDPYEPFVELSKKIREQTAGLFANKEFLDAISRANEHSRRLAEGLAKSGGLAALEAQRAQLAKIDLSRLLSNIDATRIAEIGRRFQEEYERALPPNWVGLEIEEVMAAIDCVEATGFTLVWIPRIEIVREVLNVNEDEITDIVLARRADILDDAVAVLADVTRPELLLTRQALEEAIAVLRCGYHLAAQALATSVFTSELHRFFAMSSTSKLRKKMASHDAKSSRLVKQMRMSTIFTASAKALEDFRPDTALPPRVEYNRHNTAHRITPEQWCERNALSAVMLATALLREVECWDGVNGVDIN